MLHRTTKLMVTLAVALAAASCSPGASSKATTTPGLTGSWRAVLESPGGELPFLLVISDDPSAASGLRAVAVNGPEEAPFSSISIEAQTVLLDFDFYDSAITAELDSGAHRLVGFWKKVVPEGVSRLPFHADRLEASAPPLRFLPASSPESPRQFAGTWAVEFTDESGTETARAEFVQNEGLVTGTFLTPTGDYRFLEGAALGNQLRLSTFDGGHAFLFHATLGTDGFLTGDFWSRDTYHATWTARPMAKDKRVLPDAWSLVGLTNSVGRFAFEFPDLDGRPLSLANPRFENKVVLVNIFGSWCPNCNDEAPYLSAWDRRLRNRGLEIVGLAYEFSGDPARDARQVRRYAARHGIEFPLLLAGVSDKAAAGSTLPDLSAVIAYPTSVFIGRDGKVRKIYTGFAGPGTGEHHQKLLAEFESLLEDLLAEPVV